VSVRAHNSLRLRPAEGFYQRVGGVDWSSLAAFGFPFLIYILTLAPTIYNLDSAELTTAVTASSALPAIRST
jgi:hypothetical protein